MENIWAPPKSCIRDVMRGGILVAYCPLVNVVIVLDQPEFAILFLYEEERGCIRGYGWVDVALCKLLVNKGIEILIFLLSHRVDMAVNSIGYAWLEVNGMVSTSFWGKML